VSDVSLPAKAENPAAAIIFRREIVRVIGDHLSCGRTETDTRSVALPGPPPRASIFCMRLSVRSVDTTRTGIKHNTSCPDIRRNSYNRGGLSVLVLFDNKKARPPVGDRHEGVAR
jgi:hypothetical protein